MTNLTKKNVVLPLKLKGAFKYAAYVCEFTSSTQVLRDALKFFEVAMNRAEDDGKIGVQRADMSLFVVDLK